MRSTSAIDCRGMCAQWQPIAAGRAYMDPSPCNQLLATDCRGMGHPPAIDSRCALHSRTRIVGFNCWGFVGDFLVGNLRRTLLRFGPWRWLDMLKTRVLSTSAFAGDFLVGNLRRVLLRFPTKKSPTMPQQFPNYLLRAIPTPEYWQQCWPSAAAVLGCTMVAITVRILAASIEVEEL